VIGPQTVATAAERGLAGIAVAAGTVLVADKAEVIRGANGAGLFVMGVAGASASPASAGRSGSAKGSTVPHLPALAALGVSLPTRTETADASLGVRVVAAVSAFAPAAAALVSRRHVLAVGVGEDAEAFTARVRGLRQWGDKGRWRRRGVLVVAGTQPLMPGSLATIADARFAGVVLMTRPEQPVELIEAADRLGLFVLAPKLDAGGSGQ
jgi:DUF1009 family protein